VITTLLVGLVGFSRTLYSIAFVYTFLANAFFLVRVLCTFHVCPHIPALASFITLCGSARCWCITRSCWHRFSRTTFAAHHLSLSRRCRADFIHGCIGPCITREWHTSMYSPMVRAASILIAPIIKQPIIVIVAHHRDSGNVERAMSCELIKNCSEGPRQSSYDFSSNMI